MGQNARAFKVAQKLHSQSGARMRSFNKSGNIGHHVAVLVGEVANRDHAQVRLKRGKGVVRNLGPGRRNP